MWRTRQSKVAEILGPDHAMETSWRGRVVMGDQSPSCANRDASVAEVGVHSSHSVDIIMTDCHCVIKLLSVPFPDELASQNTILFVKK